MNNAIELNLVCDVGSMIAIRTADLPALYLKDWFVFCRLGATLEAAA
jgi:hypothetical protein